PSDCQLRTILDPVEPRYIKSAFKKVFAEIQRGKGLESHLWHVNKSYLASLDATGMFSSTNISIKQLFFCNLWLYRIWCGANTSIIFRSDFV
ncbi:MAG: hypothetical protein KJN80_01375, partial [Deltaproteobacteria bacterium]|nr:hypothetical protein [Deltaproteobacteria bacterium]